MTTASPPASIHLFDAGYDNILGEVVRHWLQSPHSPETFSLHQDTTSLLLQGAYSQEVPLELPQPAYGHSKDHRPDLKQLIFGVSLQGKTGVPCAGMVFDGNTSDAFANRYHLEEFASRLPEPDKVTIVADSKLVDAITLGRLLDEGFHFVSLLSNNFNLRQQLIDRTCAEEAPLPELRRQPGRRKSDPPRLWHGRSYLRGFQVVDPQTGVRQARTLRFVVVHSSQLTARFEKGLARRLKKDAEGLKKAVRALTKQSFSCAADAQAMLTRTAPSATYHDVTWSVVVQEVALPFPGRGRPHKGQKRPTKIVWKLDAGPLTLKASAIETARRRASHFVLVSDHLPSPAWSDARLLAEYRQQSEIEGYTGFRWLKGPAAITPIFLKKPARIAALGLIFLLALMVRNVVQFWLRQALERDDGTVEGRNRKQTARPTTEAAFAHFQGVSLVQVVHSMGEVIVSRHLTGVTHNTRRILELLDVDLEVFTTPKPLPDRKSLPPTQGGPEMRDLLPASSYMLL